ncbi:menaquinone biosynthesis protein [Paenibacillus sp. HB172176]|uniref:menaquinone biosynthesis protein n=1 Tax=Paenibacillus sp. HB172176 TaxID=2493690 RepID=UPI00143AAB92|nr:menaquinone biosynthesis protein [Paenibacillus sp. HB172176]
MAFERHIAIGEIDYANAWPLFIGLERYLTGISYERKPHVPSQLNRLLSIGELDMAAVSSFAYGQHAESYALMPQLSVGSIGKVHSILLFLKKPLEEELPSRIAVTTTSATSVNLLKIVMAMKWQCTPEYIACEPRLEEMLAHSDAALLIGDPAIKASWENRDMHVVDLGEMWHNWTGLGMTYAVVAVRREAIASAANEVNRVHEAMKDTLRYNLLHREQLSDRACRVLGGSRKYWDHYFRSLQYDFGEKLRDGLALYYSYAWQLGLLDSPVDMRFMEEQSPQKVKE